MTGRNDIDGDLQDLTPDLHATITNLEWWSPLARDNGMPDLAAVMYDAITLLKASRDDKARVVALTEAIEKAPHDAGLCLVALGEPVPCTCWKKTALAAVKGGE
jgi:hypothetical protein